ncbi:hypothetical protein [Proteus mirabilis]|nr:hypothetical protein [Proteus mirabilis]MDL2100803.1 hypothetical protein [Proteus mirabilis]
MFFNNDDGELCISYQNGDADKASTFSEGFGIGVEDGVRDVATFA